MSTAYDIDPKTIRKVPVREAISNWALNVMPTHEEFIAEGPDGRVYCYAGKALDAGYARALSRITGRNFVVGQGIRVDYRDDAGFVEETLYSGLWQEVMPDQLSLIKGDNHGA